MTDEEILQIRKEFDIVPGKRDSGISVNKKKAVINNGLKTRFKKGIILPFHFKRGNEIGKDTRFKPGHKLFGGGRPKGSKDKVKRKLKNELA